MKILSIFTILFLFSQSTWANNCQLSDSKIFFQDQIGEFIPQGKGKAAKKIYPVFTKFEADYPLKASLNIPFNGDCQKLKVKKVKIYRALGANQMPGHHAMADKNDHSQHGNDIAGLSWDEKPVFDGQKDVRITSRNIILSSFNINEIAEAAPKEKHIWKLKFIIRYSDSSGKDQVITKVVNTPLIH
ncbi:MAG: hypothetical protein GY909_01480 [Oligoflexia bacterium]|nr:hypothetical protein [Oligoflexia bacterium]